MSIRSISINILHGQNKKKIQMVYKKKEKMKNFIKKNVMIAAFTSKKKVRKRFSFRLQVCGCVAQHYFSFIIFINMFPM